MDLKNIWINQKLIDILVAGGVAVMPTDTIYGIVGSALVQNTVERIYGIRKRTPSKPCIILIGAISEIQKFDIKLTDEQKDILDKYWDDSSYLPTSIVLDCPSKEFTYLHRGTDTLAFRLPTQKDLNQRKELRDLLLQTGPLVAPSANTEGSEPSVNITEAQQYFGDLVDLYIDGGDITSKASRVIKLYEDGNEAVLRA